MLQGGSQEKGALGGRGRRRGVKWPRFSFQLARGPFRVLPPGGSRGGTMGDSARTDAPCAAGDEGIRATPPARGNVRRAGGGPAWHSCARSAGASFPFCEGLDEGRPAAFSPDAPGLGAARGPPPKPGGSQCLQPQSRRPGAGRGAVSILEASYNPLPNKQRAGRRVLRAHSCRVCCKHRL